MKIAYCQVNYQTSPEEKRDDELLREEITKALLSLETAYCGFDNATDPDLIDCYIYQVNSALKRYRYLINQASKMQEMDPSEDVPKAHFKQALFPITEIIGVENATSYQ